MNKSSNIIEKNLPIRIFPPEIEFQGISKGPQYVITVTIQNADKIPHRVRIDPPSSENFNVDTVNTTNISPGLDMKVDVTFCTDNNDDCHDAFSVVYEENIIEIPLHAYFPHPQLEFTSFIDFDRVVLGNSVSSIIEFRNEGLADGIFSIEVDENSHIRVDPNRSMIKAKPRYCPENDSSWIEKVRFEFIGEEVGSYRGVATVHVEGQQDRLIDINAIVVQQKLEVLYASSRESIDSISFGPVYYGQQKSLKLVVVNNGPEPCTYMITHNDTPVDVKENEDEITQIDSVTVAPPDYDPLVFTPKTGLINPYQESIVTFTFKPKFEGRTEGFQSDPAEDFTLPYTSSITLECSETKQTLLYNINATMIHPLMTLSTGKIDFGDCPTNDRLDYAVTLTNGCKELPMEWCINKIAHFHCNPSSGMLYPSQSLDIVVSFVPTQLGKFKSMYQIVCNKGLCVLPLKVQGTCNIVGNKTSHIKTLKEAPKFAVNNIDGTNTKPPKYTRPEPWDDIEEDDKVRRDDSLFQFTKDSVYTFGVSKLVQQKEHKDKYNQMIRQSRLNKEAKYKEAKNKGLSDIISDPNNVDLGIPPHDGLSSPKLPLPPAKDPLWLKEAVDSNGKIASKKQLVNVDEDVLIKKYYYKYIL